MSATYNLPCELTDHIIDLLHDDRPSLGKCALTCKAFLPRARMYLFKDIFFYLHLDSAELCWKKLLACINQEPSLGQLVDHLQIIGGQNKDEMWGIFAPNALQITPDTFPSLTSLCLYQVSLPSIEHLVALALSIPSLKRLICGYVSYTDPARDPHPTKTPRWYSQPLTRTEPCSKPPTLSTLCFIGAFWVRGPTLGTATDIVTSLMEAKLHVGIEVLETEGMGPQCPAKSPSWLPMVRECAPNLRKLNLCFDAATEGGASVMPAFVDALRALPRLEFILFRIDPHWADADSSDPFVNVFIPGLVKLVCGAPTPFPALRTFRLDYFLHVSPDTPHPYPAGTEEALHQLLDGFIGKCWSKEDKTVQRRYPELSMFALEFFLYEEVCDEQVRELARFKGELAEKANGVGVRLEVEHRSGCGTPPS